MAVAELAASPHEVVCRTRCCPKASFTKRFKLFKLFGIRSGRFSGVLQQPQPFTIRKMKGTAVRSLVAPKGAPFGATEPQYGWRNFTPRLL